MNTQNKTNRKTTRRVAFAALLALLLCASAVGVVAFAARWFNQTNKTNNTVTVDQPVLVTVSGAASNGTIMPGFESTAVKTVFNIVISGGTGVTEYNLVIRDIKYSFHAASLATIKDIDPFDDTAEIEAIFGAGYDDEYFAADLASKSIEDGIAFAAFLSEFRVNFGGDTIALEEGMILDTYKADAANLEVFIWATDDLQLIARGGT
ncbi:MAG: hypothetical protein FWE62_01175, partial [Firmicutes bacterium]|nr:hypothetical protein [Bacillota bacterium]